MNKKILLHSGIVTLVAFSLFFLLRFLYPDYAGFEIKLSFMILSATAGVVNWARWTGIYARTHPNDKSRKNMWPYFTKDTPDADAVCFNCFKWIISIFLFFRF